MPDLQDIGVLVAWLATGLLWMYVPLAYQHRLTFGLQPAMAVLAAIGWQPTRHFLSVIFRRCLFLRSATARALATSLLCVLAVSLPLTVFAALSVSAATNAPITLYTVDRDTYAIGEWIAERAGPGDVTLGSVNTGEVLSGFLPGRVVIARKAGTIGYPEKLERIEAIYRGELGVDETLAFLRANRVSYIIVGPEESKIGANDPGAQLGLPPAHRVGAAVVYRLPADYRPAP